MELKIFFSYLASFNYKSGDGFRPNSGFNSKNYFFQINYKLSNKTKIKAEFTLLDYLAQQAGGLSDGMFNENPFQSNRSRNWFNIDWLLFQTKIKHSFSDKSKLDIQLFGLSAQRDALGYRTNRVSAIDPNTYRDLISGKFKNYGLETKWLKEFRFFTKKFIFLLGGKWYSTKYLKSRARKLVLMRILNYNQENPYLINLIIVIQIKTVLFSEQIFYLNKKYQLVQASDMSTLTQKQLAIIKKLILMEPVMLLYLKISKINGMY